MTSQYHLNVYSAAGRITYCSRIRRRRGRRRSLRPGLLFTRDGGLRGHAEIGGGVACARALPLPDLEKLRDLLWNKYQRGRVPHGHVKFVDKLVAVAREEERQREKQKNRGDRRGEVEILRRWHDTRSE